MRLRRSESWVVLVVALVLCAGAATVSAQIRTVVLPIPPAVAGVPTSMSAGALPLVKSDPELTDWLAKARAAIEKKEYAEAIKILQALIEKTDAGFVPAEKNARRFLPLRDVALRLLGEIPPEGLERYRRLYDPKARRKLDDAVTAGDLRGIKTVAEQYRFTRVGPAAAEALGQWYFDRARFAQAGRVWRELLRGAGNERAALWRLKTAVAYHLAGDAKKADAPAKELREIYPNARATLAGREQNILAALETYLAVAPPASPASPVLQHMYPGWGGLPTGQAVMPDTRAVLQSYWRHPAPEASNQGLQINPGIPGNVELDGGHVSLRIRQGNHRMTRFLPSLLRPVVVGDLVIYRNDDRVIAVDARAGRSDTNRGWKSQPLPRERKLQTRAVTGARRAVMFRPHNMQSLSISLYDRGRYSLTVGGGRVYTVCHFPLPGVQFIRNRVGGAVAVPLPSGSSLAALSLRGQGKLDWIVGWAAKPSAGGDAFLHECTFLSSPAYVPSASRREEGRLYTTVLHGQAFTLVCLDAATGRLYWKTQIAQTPIVKGARYNPMSMAWGNTPMSPPAVAEDRVFVSTNAGVTAAFDAHTGQPIWAYQYGDATANPRVLLRLRTRKTTAGTTRGGVNPMIVSDGVVISMPVDAEEVMGFSATDGTLLWRRARNRHLAALDAGRVCLAGQGVSVLRAKDGKELWRNGAIECFADPAATTNSLLLPGKGKLWRVALKDYAITSEPLQADGLLGNLVSVDGTLIAANALGLCAYFDYDRTFAGLTERMKNTSVAQRIDLLQQRGELSFTTAQYEEALKDYTAAEELVNSLPDGEEKRFGWAQLRQRRYRTYIALGNGEKDAAKGLTWFNEAKNLARTNQERAHMLIRTARLHERVGRFAEAVETAQALYEQYPEEQVVDVRIGRDVNPRQSFGPKDATRPGKVWTHQFINRMIQIHGQEVYAKFDAQAEQALQLARRENTPEAYAVIRKCWPWSQYVDNAIFAAAEAYYTLAKNAEDPAEADESLHQCENLLQEVTIRRDNPHRSSALAALTMIYTATGRPILAHRARIQLDDVPVDTPIVFADMQGPLEKVLKKLREKEIRIPRADISPSSFIKPPVQPVFGIRDTSMLLLCDQQFRPVMAGNYFLVQRGKQTWYFDVFADSPRDAFHCAALTNINAASVISGAMWDMPHQLLAHQSKDGKITAVACRWKATAFETKTGKLRWQRALVPKGLSNLQKIWTMGVGEGLIVCCEREGRVFAVNVSDGATRWKSSISCVEPYSSPMICHGVVVISAVGDPRRDHRKQTGYTGKLVVLDADTGQLLHTINSPLTIVQMYAGPAGQLAVMADGKLSLCLNPKKKDSWRTLASFDFDHTIHPRILGLGRQYVFVSPQSQMPGLVLVPFSPNKKQIRLTTNKQYPIHVARKGHRLFVTTSSTSGYNEKAISSSHLQSYNGCTLFCYDIQSGKQLWSREIRPSSIHFQAGPLGFTQEHILLTSRGGYHDRTGFFVLLDAKTGRIVQDYVFPGKASGVIPRAHVLEHRFQMAGDAAVLDNRMLIETVDGIKVFSGN